MILFSMAYNPNKMHAQGRRPNQDDGAPKVGDIAPTFKLKTLDGAGEVDLTPLIGKRPIILIFGSYT